MQMLLLSSCLFVGGVAHAANDQSDAVIDAQALSRAADLAQLAVAAYERGEAVFPEHVQPTYLRDNVALTLVEQQALRAAISATGYTVTAVDAHPYEKKGLFSFHKK